MFCGVMNYEPNEEAGIRLIRDIWPLVRTRRPDARLTVVGAYPSARLREAARPDSTVKVTGAVPDVRPYLWESAVSAAPLRTARGLQNKVLEALAADLPVVTTPAVADGLPAAVLPGCAIADSESASADAIVSLLGLTESERRSVARRADLSQLAWDRQLSPIVPILTAAARGKSARRLAS